MSEGAASLPQGGGGRWGVIPDPYGTISRSTTPLLLGQIVRFQDYAYRRGVSLSRCRRPIRSLASLRGVPT
jgi:hypothetical protein